MFQNQIFSHGVRTQILMIIPGTEDAVNTQGKSITGKTLLAEERLNKINILFFLCDFENKLIKVFCYCGKSKSKYCSEYIYYNRSIWQHVSMCF